MIEKLKEVRHLITYDCPLRCLHCYMSAGEHNKIKSLKFSQEQADKFYGFFKPEVVSATGGEPLLEYELVKILAKATERYGGALELVTNGLLLTENKVQELNGLNTKLFYQISLDGNESYHNNLRQNDLAYESAINAIELSSQTGRKVKVRMTVMPDNLSQIPDVIKKLDSYQKENISLVMRPVIGSGRAKENGLGFNEDFSKKISINEGQSKYVKVETTDNRGKCGCGADTLAINPLGEIFPCCYMVFNPEYRMGNFLENFQNIQRNADFENFTGTCYARHRMAK